MVRKPKDEEPAGIGDNSVSDDVRRSYYKQALKAKQEHERLVSLAKTANGEYRAVLKIAKKQGVCIAAIVNTLKLRNVDHDELVYEQRETARMLALAGIWPSIQQDLFNTLTEVDLTAEVTVEVAYDNGHTCGVKGENRDLNPHFQGTEKYDAWDRGWLTGQGNNVEKLTKRSHSKKKSTPAVDPVEPEMPSEPEPLFSED